MLVPNKLLNMIRFSACVHFDLDSVKKCEILPWRRGGGHDRKQAVTPNICQRHPRAFDSICLEVNTSMYNSLVLCMFEVLDK